MTRLSVETGTFGWLWKKRVHDHQPQYRTDELNNARGFSRPLQDDAVILRLAADEDLDSSCHRLAATTSTMRDNTMHSILYELQLPP